MVVGCFWAIDMAFFFSPFPLLPSPLFFFFLPPPPSPPFPFPLFFFFVSGHPSPLGCGGDGNGNGVVVGVLVSSLAALASARFCMSSFMLGGISGSYTGWTAADPCTNSSMLRYMRSYCNGRSVFMVKLGSLRWKIQVPR